MPIFIHYAKLHKLQSCICSIGITIKLYEVISRSIIVNKYIFQETELRHTQFAWIVYIYQRN